MKGLLMNSKELIAMLTADGWTLSRTEGSHHIYVKKGNPMNIAVPHPKKDLKKGLVAQIMRKAGIK